MPKAPDIKMPEIKVPEIKMPEIKMPEIKVPEVRIGRSTGYRSNKDERKAQVEAGPPPWTLAWADDISETDAALGLVAAGVSVASANPGPFLAWIEELLRSTLETLRASAAEKFPAEIQNDMKAFAADAIRLAISGKNPNEAAKAYDTIDFKAGAIKYEGKNVALGHVISRTWGMKPYVGFRLR
ncbi:MULTISPECIES: hypothetical protein [Paenibacillus]|nr:hypothetical protein [Paenibacillus polymyxa]URJ42127.1 hypothetical protein MF627_001780 [Paenibacillus polymyxa]